MRASRILLLALASGLAVSTGVAPASAAPTATIATGPSAAEPTAVTLVTGHLAEPAGDGSGVVGLSAPDGTSGASRAEFEDAHGDHHVWPTDVIPLIGDLLDPRLFNVDLLLQHGFVDRAGPPLPLLVEHDADAQLPPGTRLVEPLPDGSTWRVTVDVGDRARLGRALLDAAAGGRALDGISSIRLDLDKETPEPVRGGVTLTVVLSPHEAGAAFAGTLHVQPIGRIDAGQVIPVHEEDATVELEVEPGTYHLSFQSEQTIDGSPALVDVSTHDVEVDGDTTVVLDGATADDIEVEVGRPVTRRDGLIGGVLAPEPDSNQHYYGMQVNGSDGLRLLVAPTSDPVEGEHEFVSIQTLISDDPSYHLMYVEPDGVPDGLTYAPEPTELAQIDHALHADVEGRDYLMRSLGYLGGTEVYLEGSTFAVDAAAVHTSWTTPEYWNFVVFAGDREGSAGLLEDSNGPWPVGVTELSWFAPVVRSGSPRGDWLAYQFDDHVGFQVRSFVDAADNGAFYWYEPDPELDTITYEIDVDGETVLTGEGDPYSATVEIPAEPTRVDLRLDVARRAPWWLSSTSTSTSWSFTTEPQGDPFVPKFPAMLQIDYEVETDLTNRAAAPATIRFEVYQPGEEPLGIPAESLRLWSSTDRGETWADVPVDGLGDGMFEAVVTSKPGCADPCRVSLRALGEDVEGNTVDQTIIDAFVLGGPSATPTATPTLPPTGSGDVAAPLGLAWVALLAGGLLIGLAHRRLRAA